MRENADNFLRIQHRRQVGLIQHRNDRQSGHFPNPSDNFPVLIRQRFRQVKHRQHQPGRFQTGQGNVDPNFFYRIIGLSNTGGIRQPEHHIPQIDCLLDDVPGRAGNIGHNTARTAAEQVHQR